MTFYDKNIQLSQIMTKKVKNQIIIKYMIRRTKIS